MDEQFANQLWSETGLRELVCGRDDEVDEGEEEEGMSREERRELWYVLSCHEIFGAEEKFVSLTLNADE